MSRFLARRTLASVPILFGVSVVVFITLKLTPGSPVDTLLGPTSTPQDRAQLTHQLGLDSPLPEQFFDWLARIVQGNFGMSIAQQLPARPIVLDAFYNTLILTLFAATFAMAFGVALGGISALRDGKATGAAASGISLFAVSAPQYSLGLVLIVVFTAHLGWLPSSGMYNAANPGGLPDLFVHLLLPGISAGLVPLGIIARMFRSSLLEVLGQDFIESYRARGIATWKIYLHAVHNTLPALLTVAGLQIGYLLGGVLFVETIFSWPGLGQLIYDSISQRDFPVIQAGVLISALAFVVLNLIVDALHGLIDPRIRT